MSCSYSPKVTWTYVGVIFLKKGKSQNSVSRKQIIIYFKHFSVNIFYHLILTTNILKGRFIK